MNQRAIFIILVSIVYITALKIPIVEEDFIEIMIGTPPRPMKLLIDPVAPFSYINTNYTSSLSYETTHDPKNFSNIFGDFEGEWANDFFYLTPDKYFPLKMKFLQIQKSNSIFKVDGVIGLGYSEKMYHDCSIYHNLAKLSEIFPTENVLSYDKTKKLLTIGEFPQADNANPVTFPIFEGMKDYPATFVNLTSILVKDKKGSSTFVNVEGYAKLGLMSLIIAPSELKSTIADNYNKLVESSNSTFTLNSKVGEFYVDYLTQHKNANVSTEMIFNKIAYKFDHTVKDGDDLVSNIRLNTNPNIKFWYIGLDNLNVQRADFDYRNGTVTLFSPTAYDIFGNKAYILFSFVLFGAAFCIVLGVVARTQCQKKRRSQMTKDEDDELI